MKRSEPYLLFSTVPSRKEAEEIARILIENRLAACVNVAGSVQSFFRWQGKLEKASEWLLVIKTQKSCLKKLSATLRRHHSYEVPELIGWPICWGHPPYLAWLKDSVTGRFFKGDRSLHS